MYGKRQDGSEMNDYDARTRTRQLTTRNAQCKNAKCKIGLGLFGRDADRLEIVAGLGKRVIFLIAQKSGVIGRIGGQSKAQMSGL